MQDRDCDCKVGRVSAKYELHDVNSQLVEKWQSGTSIRRLTKSLNKKIIESELTAANVSQLKWSQTPVYKALHTNQLSDAEEIEIRRELDRAGVEVNNLASDLMSHQTLYRHVTQCLGESKDDSPTPQERRSNAKNTVYGLQHRTEIVTRSNLETLESAGITNLGDFEVLVDLQVVCGDCGRSMSFDQAITEGCNCDEGTL